MARWLGLNLHSRKLFRIDIELLFINVVIQTNQKQKILVQ